MASREMTRLVTDLINKTIAASSYPGGIRNPEGPIAQFVAARQVLVDAIEDLEMDLDGAEGENGMWRQLQRGDGKEPAWSPLERRVIDLEAQVVALTRERDQLAREGAPVTSES